MGEPSNVSPAAMNPRVGRRQLVTCSQADGSKFPNRERFGKMLEVEFKWTSGF